MPFYTLPVAGGSPVLSGNGAPAANLGSIGDIYVDQQNGRLYGPKQAGGWGGGFSIIGPTGPQGSPNSLSIGTVAGGTEASATITGTAPSQTLNLVLPAGATGATGSVGATGPAGATGATGPANSLSIGTVTGGTTASATITGAAPTQTLNLVLPAGATGSTGPAGPANSLSIGTVTTGVAGSSASASVTGTAPTQVLNLTIPRGDAGSAGSQGPPGSFGDPQTIQAKTASYTLQLSDVGTLLTFSATSGTITVTIPQSSSVAWVAGSHIDVARLGSADVAFAGQSGVGITATPSASLRAVGSGGSLVYLGSDEWLLVGDLA